MYQKRNNFDSILSMAEAICFGRCADPLLRFHLLPGLPRCAHAQHQPGGLPVPVPEVEECESLSEVRQALLQPDGLLAAPRPSPRRDADRVPGLQRELPLAMDILQGGHLQEEFTPG